jgi:hypothetical protein
MWGCFVKVGFREISRDSKKECGLPHLDPAEYDGGVNLSHDIILPKPDWPKPDWPKPDYELRTEEAAD